MAMYHKGGKVTPYHGDAHPVSVYQGRKTKNLLDTSNLQVASAKGITWTRNDDGTINAVGTSTGESSALFMNKWAGYNIEDTPFEIGETYSLDIQKTSGTVSTFVTVDFWAYTTKWTVLCGDNSSTTTERYFTIPDGTTIIRCRAYVNSDVTVDGTFSVQVEKGSTATSYEPYGVVPDTIYTPTERSEALTASVIDSTYNDAAVVTEYGESTQETLEGKNLVADSYIVAGYVNPGTDYPGMAAASGGVFCSVDIPTLAAGTYTLCFDRTVNIVRFVSDSKHDTNYAMGQGTVSNVAKYTFTLDADYENVWFSWRDATSSTTKWEGKVWLVSGSEVLDYEPYCGGIPSPNPDYPQDIVSRSGAVVTSSSADGTRTSSLDLASLLAANGIELRSLPDGTRDEVTVNRDGSVTVTQRCDPDKFDPTASWADSGHTWAYDEPQVIDLGTASSLPTYYPATTLTATEEVTATVRTH